MAKKLTIRAISPGFLLDRVDGPGFLLDPIDDFRVDDFEVGDLGGGQRDPFLEYTSCKSVFVKGSSRSKLRVRRSIILSIEYDERQCR
jgi:hypothetical protein